MGLIDSKAQRDVIDAANARSLLLAGKIEEEYLLLLGRVRELERQRDFVLMRRMPSECLLPQDCVYLAGEPCNWRCTASLEVRKKCLGKAVERAEGATGKTADVDAEQAAREAGE